MSKLIALIALPSLLLLPAGVSGPEQLRDEIARIAAASKGVVGVAAVNLGRHQSRHAHPERDISPGAEAAANAEAEALERTATPRAMVRFLADLQRGRLLSERNTAILLDT